MKNRLSLLQRRLGGAGFTLIELMIVVVIVGILAAIALPAYTDYIKRGKIPQATSALSSMRIKLEQYFQDQRKYTGACDGASVAPLPAADAFTYTCPTLDATHYTVQATGNGTMTGFTYTIDQDNVKTTTNLPSAAWGTAPITCWVTAKGGACQ